MENMEYQHYLVLCGSAVVDGPKFTDDPKEIEEFFEYVKKINKEYGQDSMRVIDPRVGKQSKKA